MKTWARQLIGSVLLGAWLVLVAPTGAGAAPADPSPAARVDASRVSRVPRLDCVDLVAARARERERRRHHRHHHDHDDDECGPPPTVPEVPITALRPLTAAGVTAVAFGVRRRNQRNAFSSAR